jgi:hypothetical protein
MPPASLASYCAEAERLALHPMSTPDFSPERMLQALSDREVRFVLIGGMAAVLHGDVGVTVDLDVVPEHSDPIWSDSRERSATWVHEYELRGSRVDCHSIVRQSSFEICPPTRS